MARSTQAFDSTEMYLPRILCLHGGGTNAAIFRTQMRAILVHSELKGRFRFVFADAPFTCDEGIGVGVVYAEWGPFRRWSRWLQSHPEIDASHCHSEILSAISRAMTSDEGRGEWVGVLGFSQGAKVACSLLLKQQMDLKEDYAVCGAEFKFGVIFAGRAPIMALDADMEKLGFLQGAARLMHEADMDEIYDAPEYRLRLPTVHVHGLQDEGLELHRRCAEDYCAAGTTSVVELDLPHRLPIKRGDVQKVVDAIIGLVDEYDI